jgi:amidase
MSEPLAPDLEAASASALVEALAARRVSALELADAAIQRIEARDAALNAVVVRDFDRARDQAKAADAALARGERRPLLGLPMTVKEAHHVAGMPTSWGLPRFKNWRPNEDGAAIARLKAAGAVILGKTNIATFLADWQSDNPVYGRSNHPWDQSRTPGGSSGGGAAAVASRLVPLEFGSDLVGSIRVPAAFCGIFGHKPSFGLVPAEGFAPPGVTGAPIPLAVLGPLARSAQDLGLALEVLAGPEGDEARGYRLALPAPRHRRLKEYRALILDRHPAAEVAGEIRDALHRLGERLAAAGATVARRAEALPDLAAAHELFLGMLGVVTSLGAPDASPVSAQQWFGMIDAQRALRRRWSAFFASVDVVLAPAFGVNAFPHDAEPDLAKRRLVIDGKETPYLAQGAWSGIAGVANLPATVAPIERSDAGLPIGIQIIGPYLEDRTTLDFAALIVREFGGSHPLRPLAGGEGASAASG